AADPASNLLPPQAPPGPNPHSPRRINDNVLRSYCGTQYRYDERGNLAERTTGSTKGHFDWDLYNRLRRYEDDRLIVTYAYDALGRRLYKHSRSKYRDRPQAGPVWNQNARRQRDEELGCGYTWYVWEGDTLAFECRDREGKGHTTHYVFEPGTFVPVAQAVSNHVVELLRQPVYVFPYDIDKDPVWLHKPMPKAFDAMAWYQCDQLGTPMELTGEDGEIAWSGRYKAWGLAEEQRSDGAKWAEIRNPLRFQGQYWDVETGLHYNRHRYYDPQVGRFIGKDPIGFWGGINFYAFAPNPIEFTDPLGLVKKTPALGSEKNPFATSRGARREAMRQIHLPTSQQPVSQSRNQSGFEYRFETSQAGGGKGLASVQQQTMDLSHPDKPHWEAGTVKLDDQGNPRMSKHSRPQIQNGKGKAFYEKECCQ
ncbi:RHS repeat-associated core domain-containing protein, partial [Pseudomonas asiatica]|uniref:RHS repeat-associated core domain-containing protein n=1 Tax=Pseudomonas asiatica TaxID=2219225 RepID=UPI001F189EE5